MNETPRRKKPFAVFVLQVALAFACIGLVFGLRLVALATLPHIIPENGIAAFQDVEERLPIPRSLDWNIIQIDALAFFGANSAMIRTLFGVLLTVALGLLAITTLNPSFRLPASRVTWRRISLVLLAIGLPLALVWLLTDRLIGPLPLGSNGEIVASSASRLQILWAVRAVLLGALLWIGFRPDGLAGQLDAPFDPTAPVTLDSLARATRPATLVRLGVGGAGVGLLLYACSRLALSGSLDSLVRHYQLLGTFHQGYFWAVAIPYLTAMVMLWAGGGALFALFARPGVDWRQRGGLLAFPLLALVACLPLRGRLSSDAQATRFDWTADSVDPRLLSPPPGQISRVVPDGPEAGAALARRAKIASGLKAALPPRNLLLFSSRGVRSVEQRGYTEDGLTASPESAQKVRKWLEGKDYETALSWVAIKHLFNVGTYHFDTTTAIESCLLDMAHCPHLAQCNTTTRAMLFACAASPENLALLDRWADSAAFLHPDRFSCRLIGDLYVRMGEPQKGLAWYKQAEMPRSFLNRVQHEPPMFRAGRITGTLRWNGKPLAGVQVGALPVRLNGLPKDMEPLLLQSETELLAPRWEGFGFPPFRPRPWRLRWISAGTMTDAQGRFSLDHLTEGEYRLVCSLPPESRLRVPFALGLDVKNAPLALNPTYQKPVWNVGTVDMRYAPPPKGMFRSPFDREAPFSQDREPRNARNETAIKGRGNRP